MLPPTPALLLDVRALDANLAAMQRHATAAGVRLRPHVKGHKSAWVAGRQLAAGADGLAAATREEVAGLIAAGHGGDVLLTSVLSPRRIDDVVALRRAGDVAVVVDDPELPAVLAERVRAATGVPRLRVLLDLDVGQRRGAARTPEAAVAIAAAAAREADVLELTGVQAYEGHLQMLPEDERAAGHAGAMDVLRAMLDALHAAGHATPLVTSAGTGTAALAGPSPLITEVQPGSYALMDAKYAATGAAFAPAVHVLTTVLSAPGDGEVLVDAGLKAVSIDHGPAAVVGLDATWEPAGDEHGRVRGDVGALRPGDQLLLHPAHTDTTVRLHRVLWVAEDDATPPLALPMS